MAERGYIELRDIGDGEVSLEGFGGAGARCRAMRFSCGDFGQLAADALDVAER